MLPSQLVAWRTAGGMSREAAAKLLGCSAKSLERYESGNRTVPDKIASAVLTLGKTADTSVELVPPHDRANYLTWDNPQNSPRLWRPGVGKKAGTSWERLAPGQPMLPPGTSYFDTIERVDREAYEARQKYEAEEARKKNLKTPFQPPTDD